MCTVYQCEPQQTHHLKDMHMSVTLSHSVYCILCCQFEILQWFAYSINQYFYSHTIEVYINYMYRQSDQIASCKYNKRSVPHSHCLITAHCCVHQLWLFNSENLHAKFVGISDLQRGTRNAVLNTQTLGQRRQAGSAQSWSTVVRQPTESLVVTAEECQNVTRQDPASKPSSFLSWTITILRRR